MKYSCTALFLVLWCLGASAQPMQREANAFDQMGLTLTEQEMVKDSALSVKSVQKLVECGISVTEYFKKPWIGLKISEKKWIKNRCHGLSNDDMAPRTKATLDSIAPSSPTDGK